MRLRWLTIVILAAGCGQDNRDEPGAGFVDWPLHGLTHGEQRFGPLDAINEETVARLGLAWSIELGSTRGLEATPIVVDGIIYTTGAWSVVHAIDGRSGEMLWTFDPRGSAKPGARAVLRRGQSRCRAGQGESVRRHARRPADRTRCGGRRCIWEAATFDPARGYSITGAPRVAGDVVVIGNGGAEMGVRGYVTAYDVDSGELAWRSHIVPGDLARGFESDAMERAAET